MDVDVNDMIQALGSQIANLTVENTMLKLQLAQLQAQQTNQE